MTPFGSASEGGAIYGDELRRLFPRLDPRVEDLRLLQGHQVEGLLSRASAAGLEAELAAILHAHPDIRNDLLARHPLGMTGLDALLARHGPLAGHDLAAAAERLLWEVADEIVYQRAPDAYDEVAQRDWDDRAVTDVANLSVLDGTLDGIPLPDGSADVLITNRAVGWRLAAELAEVERVVGHRGTAVHLTGMPYPAPGDDPLHAGLLAAGYIADAYEAGGRSIRRYRARFEKS